MKCSTDARREANAEKDVLALFGAFSISFFVLFVSFVVIMR